MHKSRLEAFSDGVLAIILTIMVLEMKVPHGNATWGALRPVLPVFFSYLLSFVYLGIYWNNHHHLLQAATKGYGQNKSPHCWRPFAMHDKETGAGRCRDIVQACRRSQARKEPQPFGRGRRAAPSGVRLLTGSPATALVAFLVWLARRSAQWGNLF